jgi:predicted metal-dependent enzyme (double-stranded beta helix superfamily)
MPTSTLRPRMRLLVTEIRGALRAPEPDTEVITRRVADLVGDCLRYDDLLTAGQSASDPVDYRQHVLHTEPDGSFSVVALVWLPGQRTPIHDHVSWCVVGTLRGAEEEICYRLVDDDGPTYLEPVHTTVNRAGEVAYLTPPGDIHEVRGVEEGVTISLHVYGADIARLGTSIRRRYDLPVSIERL